MDADGLLNSEIYMVAVGSLSSEIYVGAVGSLGQRCGCSWVFQV